MGARSTRSWVAGLVALAGLLGPATARAENTTAEPPGPQITFHVNAAGVRGAKLRLYLRSTPEKIWEAVTTPAKATQLFKAIVAIKQSSRGPQFREYHLTSILGDKLVICAVRQDDAGHQVHWKRVDGHLDDMEGYYKIRVDERYPGYSLVEYGSYIDPGAVARALMTNRGRQRDIEYMIAQLRRMTE